MKPESAPNAKKYLPIPYGELHPEVRKQIDTLFSMRKVRGLQSAGGAFALGISIPVATSLDVPPLTIALFAAGGASGYALGSGPVTEQTKRVGEAVRKHGFFAEDVPDRFERLAMHITLKKTHPAFYIDSEKNMVLVPRTRWESIVQKVGAGRKRVRY